MGNLRDDFLSCQLNFEDVGAMPDLSISEEDLVSAEPSKVSSEKVLASVLEA